MGSGKCSLQRCQGQGNGVMEFPTHAGQVGWHSGGGGFDVCMLSEGSAGRGPPCSSLFYWMPPGSSGRDCRPRPGLHRTSSAPGDKMSPSIHLHCLGHIPGK
jgi:hypothetical protein